MQSPDILGVEEAKNLDVLNTLANRVNTDTVAAGGADPGYIAFLAEGNDPGGIDVGFLVQARQTADPTEHTSSSMLDTLPVGSSLGEAYWHDVSSPRRSA